MVDSSYGGGPPNSNISQYQVSGQYISGIFNSIFSSGQAQASGASGPLTSGGQYLSGIYTCNTPRSESSWNV